MSSKSLNKVLAVFILISTCWASSANAALIVGGTYTDAAGKYWEYVGSYDLVTGPIWNDASGDGDANSDGNTSDYATPYNGIQTAELIFGALASGSQYALSTLTSPLFVVNHLAWYDGIQISSIVQRNENASVDVGGDGLYKEVGDYSAYVKDRGFLGEKINYVFKTAEIPEPSSLAIFALTLFGLGIRRLKK